MNQINLTAYFPAGGRASDEIEIRQVKATKQENISVGKATLPLSAVEKDVLIYQLNLESGANEYRAISAKCPHQGADISHDELKKDGNVYCSLHRRPICIFSEYNHAYLVEKRGEQYFIVKGGI